MAHTKECIERSRKITKECARWVADHPKHCKTCSGRGDFTSPGSMVPYGSTFVHLPDDVEPCEQCSGKGICPWCGEPGLTSEDRGDESTGDGPCKACGYDPLKDWAPDGECDCICQEY